LLHPLTAGFGTAPFERNHRLGLLLGVESASNLAVLAD